MPWVKLDDGFADHPKLLALSADLRWKHLSAMCWSAKHATNGLITRRIASQLGLRSLGISKLIESQLWDINDADSWLIHDWNVYNPDAESAKQDRDDWETKRLQFRANERDRKRLERQRKKEAMSQDSSRDSHGTVTGPLTRASRNVTSRHVTSLDSDSDSDRESKDSDSSSGTQNPSLNGKTELNEYQKYWRRKDAEEKARKVSD